MTIYLYIKQHHITGLKYFGKTKKLDPFKYNGSGAHWVNHYKKHGKEFIKTLDVFGFDNQEDATEFALNFSKQNNIVESKDWANEIPEDAKTGGRPKGHKLSKETKLKMSASQLARTTGRTWNSLSKAKRSIQYSKNPPFAGKKHSIETKNK
jgi:hypothetical protein